MAIDPNEVYGGPQLYNPALGMTIMQSPDLIVRHLAARGVPPPADIPEGADHVDAANSLGRALAFNTQQGNAFGPNEKVLPYQSGDAPSPFMPGIESGGVQPGQQPLPQEPPPAKTETFDERWASEPGTHPARIHPQTPQRPQVVSGPTPAPEAAPTTGQPPANDTSDQPGGVTPLPRPDPRTAQASEQQGKDPLDTLGSALAGLHAMPYNNPLHIYSPQAPRPTNMIARSTVPQTLMGEIAGLSHPSSTFRLGEALRGKAYG